MKKVLLIAFVFFALQGYAQKQLAIYNVSSVPVDVTDIITNATGAYPEFSVKYFGPIILPPLTGQYLLETTHPTRFPFDSPSSVPYIGSWERLDSPTAPIFMMTGYGAWLMGDPQVFDRLEFKVGGVSYSINTTNVFPSVVSAGPVTAEYIPPVGTATIYTVVFY